MDLPAPPRRIRPRTAFAHWWPLGLVAGVATVLLTVTLVVLLAQDGFRLPNRDSWLDQRAFRALDGAEVLAVTPVPIHFGSRNVVRVRYRGRVDRTTVEGECYALTPAPTPGARVPFEYSPEDPQLHRLVGTQLAISSYYLPFLAGVVYLPLLLLCGFWLQRGWRLLLVLRHGPATTAVLVDAVLLRHVNPQQLRVRYRFAAPGGELQAGQWLRATSPLAGRIRATAPGAAIPGAGVVYDETRPSRCRLLAVEDAAPER